MAPLRRVGRWPRHPNLRRKRCAGGQIRIQRPCSRIPRPSPVDGSDISTSDLARVVARWGVGRGRPTWSLMGSPSQLAAVDAMAASGKEVDASNNSGKPRWLAATKGSDHSGGVGAFSLGAWRCKGVARQSASMCCGNLDHSSGMHDDDEVWLHAGPCSDIAGIVRWSSCRIWGPELKLGRIAPSSWAATTADRPLCPIPSHLLGAPTLLGWFIGRKELHGETVKTAAGEEGRGCRHVAVGGDIVTSPPFLGEEMEVMACEEG
uniref:Uncharacterized protein n=1 Tax=Oryza barthii TaxID=65489 RepID=A0A0D3HEV1_9ORYZ